MWQTKYALAVPKNLGVGVNFRPCSEGYFLSGRPQSVNRAIVQENSSHKVTIPKIGSRALKAYRRKPVWVMVFFKTQIKNHPVAYGNSHRKWLGCIFICACLLLFYRCKQSLDIFSLCYKQAKLAAFLRGNLTGISIKEFLCHQF